MVIKATDSNAGLEFGEYEKIRVHTIKAKSKLTEE